MGTSGAASDSIIAALGAATTTNGGTTSGSVTPGAPVVASTSMADVLSYRTCLPRSLSGSGEVRDWWREQVGYDSGSE